MYSLFKHIYLSLSLSLSSVLPGKYQNPAVNNSTRLTGLWCGAFSLPACTYFHAKQ